MMFSLLCVCFVFVVFGWFGVNGVLCVVLWILMSGVVVVVVLVVVVFDIVFIVMMVIVMFGVLFMWLMIFVMYLWFCL